MIFIEHLRNIENNFIRNTIINGEKRISRSRRLRKSHAVMYFLPDLRNCYDYTIDSPECVR